MLIAVGISYHLEYKFCWNILESFDGAVRGFGLVPFRRKVGELVEGLHRQLVARQVLEENTPQKEQSPDDARKFM